MACLRVLVGPIARGLTGEFTPGRVEASKARRQLKILAGVTMPAAYQQARLVEIAENLHRAELNVADRAAHIAEWIRLTEAKEVWFQLETKLSSRGRAGAA
jgi:hypothetical protein